MSTCRPQWSGPLIERNCRPSADPGGKGLRLAASGLPDGLTFSDLGGGKGAIEGVPQQAASASIRIVATNHHDRTAQMSATLVVGDKPAPPRPSPSSNRPFRRPRRSLSRSCGAATVDGRASRCAPAVSTAVQAPAPAPVRPNTTRRLWLSLPPPLSKQSRAWRRRRRNRLSRAERDGPPSPAAPASAEEKAKAFIASFDGGECFLIEPLPGATKPHEYQAVGRAIEPFRRFDSAYKREVGVEADLTVAPITAEQCPALDLVRLAAPAGQKPPRLMLKNYEVGPGHPLMGMISGLEGRRLYLVLVDNDGVVHRLETKAGASRRFRNLQCAADRRRELRRPDADAARGRLGQAHSGS